MQRSFATRRKDAVRSASAAGLDERGGSGGAASHVDFARPAARRWLAQMLARAGLEVLQGHHATLGLAAPRLAAAPSASGDGAPPAPVAAAAAIRALYGARAHQEALLARRQAAFMPAPAEVAAPGDPASAAMAHRCCYFVPTLPLAAALTECVLETAPPLDTVFTPIPATRAAPDATVPVTTSPMAKANPESLSSLPPPPLPTVARAFAIESTLQRARARARAEAQKTAQREARRAQQVQTQLGRMLDGAESEMTVAGESDAPEPQAIRARDFAADSDGSGGEGAAEVMGEKETAGSGSGMEALGLDAQLRLLSVAQLAAVQVALAADCVLAQVCRKQGWADGAGGGEGTTRR